PTRSTMSRHASAAASIPIESVTAVGQGAFAHSFSESGDPPDISSESLIIYRLRPSIASIIPPGTVSQPMSPSPARAQSSDDTGGRKAVLFCQDCGHTGPVDGDWRVRTVGSRRRTCCPECRRVVDDRRVTDDNAPTPVQWCVDAWSRYWSTLTTLLANGPNPAESDC
ncbi:MAG: hypothetical protein V5A16_05700, partial [Haloplanus sp.]